MLHTRNNLRAKRVRPCSRTEEKNYKRSYALKALFYVCKKQLIPSVHATGIKYTCMRFLGGRG